MKAPLTPTQLREATERDYRNAISAAGLPVDEAAIRRTALADLQLVDAAERLGEINGAPVSDNAPPKPRPDVLTEAHKAQNTRPVQIVRPFRPGLFHATPVRMGPRWPHAVARIGRICEGINSTGAIGSGTDTATVPKLAKAFALTYAQYTTRGAPPPPMGKPDYNPFRHLSDDDALRKLQRIIEDICDKSTGVLGAWYVK